MHQDWLAIYRNMDDDSLAALASIGLLRRAAKDVEAGKVALSAPVDGGIALIQSDGHLVRIGEDGPARARCDCPAPGMCKHILAATLWLRQAPAGAAAPSPPDALAEVLALDPAAVFKLAGSAATRKAGALFAESGPATIIAQAGVLVIELPALELVCRYIAGAGYTGMVSEAPAASRAAIHLLALAAVWRDQRQHFAWPDTPHSTPMAASDGLSDADRDFLARLQQLVLELCRTGWSHVSDVMPAQLRAFGMSARVESFPRLAGLLRTLAGTAELLARGDVASDERQAFQLAARIHALCHALAHSTGEVLQVLRGRNRRSFDGHGSLELLPLGAHWWEQRSGARGLTISFWDHTSRTVMQTVLARRDAHDTGFTRTTAWSASALWEGAGSAQAVVDGTVVLDNVKLSHDNRISLSSDTRARMLALWSASDERWLAAGLDDWRALAASISSGAGLRGAAVDCVLLKPSSLEPPRLDEVRQILCWTIRDRHGLPLVLRLSCDAHHLRRIEHIQAWSACGMAIKAVLARLDRDRHGCILEPVSLMVEAGGRLHTIALDYTAPSTSTAPSLALRIARMLKSKDAAIPWTPGPAHLEHIDSLLEIMENKGMTGRLHLLGEERADLAAAQQYLRATGLDRLASAVGSYLTAPDAVKALAVVHLCHTCTELDTSFIYR